MREFPLDVYDAELAAELRSRLPDRIFDAHAHPFQKREINVAGVPVLGDLPVDGGIGFWSESLAAQVGGGRTAGGLFFGLPIMPAGDIGGRIRRANRFVIDELRRCGLADARGLLLVASDSDPAEMERLLDEPRLSGFKPYSALNPRCGPAPDIHEYLPEWACELADARGLVVMLHIGKSKALDDGQNIAEINGLCARFPRMKLVLAHAGSGFNMYNTIKGCLKLAPAGNLWFDLSAVCEPPTCQALMKAFGHGRLLWGSDYPISLRKGRFVTLGGAFFAIQRDIVNTERMPFPPGAALLGLENLRAVLHAAHDCRLGDGELEDLFYGNAARLLGLAPSGGAASRRGATAR